MGSHVHICMVGVMPLSLQVSCEPVGTTADWLSVVIVALSAPQWIPILPNAVTSTNGAILSFMSQF